MRRLASLSAAFVLMLSFFGCEITTSDDPASERSFESGDLDCADVSYSQAQSLIEEGDPHGLDRDGDGEACESNY